MNEDKQAVMTALNELVNYRAYGGDNMFFFDELYELVDKDVARDITSIIGQLCQSLGTTITAELNKPRGVKYEPLHYRAIPEGDVNRALEVAVYNVMIASTDLDRMLRNKQHEDRGVK